MKLPNYLFSIRAKLLMVSAVLLLIPLIGISFVVEMERYLREGQSNVLMSAARFLSASLSDRPDLLRNNETIVSPEEVERQRTLAIFRTDIAASLGTSYQPSEAIERILRVVAKDGSRVWVIDSRSQVRGVAGNFSDERQDKPESNALERVYRGAVSRLFRLLKPAQKESLVEELSTGSKTVMAQADRALIGESTPALRYAPDGKTSVLSAAQPIYLGDDIVGAVVVEESSARNSVITLAALETLLLLTAVVFFVGFLSLLFFASRIAFRVKRLQTETGRVIDAQGRFVGQSVPSLSDIRKRDELGELAQSLQAVLGRLRSYNNYLEQMASRLAHELRTPVTVVRSSLDNLRQSPLTSNDMVYIERADEGIQRLTTLISRMSEAAQLESFLQGTEKEHFDLVCVVSGCVEGYRLGFPQQIFSFESDIKTAPILGSADAVAQLLDKLAQNAVDFSASNEAIRVSVHGGTGIAQLRVENKGTLLPPELNAQLFESMISSRIGANAQAGHLGLGLYVVQLIAEFHEAHAKAYNLPDGSGVRFEIDFPFSRTTRDERLPGTASIT
jgi:two-component system, OmpR family, sensor histidine kinase ChvG